MGKREFLVLFSILLLSQIAYSYSPNCNMSELNFTLYRIRAYVNHSEEQSSREIVGYCNHVLDDFYCERADSYTVGNVSKTCQNIHEKIEEQNKNNRTDEGFDLRRQNMEALIRNVYGYCDEPSLNCTYENKAGLLERYANLTKEYVVYHQNSVDNKCGHFIYAYNISEEIVGQEKIYWKALKEATKLDYEYVLEQAKKCIVVCETDETFKDNKPFFKECYIGKANALKDMLWTRNHTTEEVIEMRGEVALALENAGSYNESAAIYNIMANMALTNADMKTRNMNGLERIFYMMNSSEPEFMNYWMNSALLFQKAGDMNNSKLMVTEYFYQKKQLAEREIAFSIWIIWVILLFFGLVTPVLVGFICGSLNKNRWALWLEESTKNDIKNHILYWKQLDLTKLIEIIVVIWIGFAFFTSEYLNLTKTVLSLTSIDVGLWAYAKNLDKEIFAYTAYYVIFQFLGISLISLLIIKLMQPRICGEFELRRYFNSEVSTNLKEDIRTTIFYAFSKIWFFFMVAIALVFVLVTRTLFIP